jgi:hypothetical protein
MTISNIFPMALQAYKDLIPEIEQHKNKTYTEPPSTTLPPSVTLPPSTTLEEIINQNPSLPGDALMLGMANDGLPILLNLYETAPCPVLVLGDGGSGKTHLLQTLARATDLILDPSDIQFGVVTNYPDEWQVVDVSPGSMGIWSANHPSAQQFLQRMVDWAKQPTHGRQVMVLFLDDLASVINTSHEVQENIRWLLENGGKNQVWTVASLNVLRAVRMRSWLALFNTHIFGYIHQPSLARAITADTPSDFESLVPGLEFDIKQQDGWLRFWLPALKTG